MAKDYNGTLNLPKTDFPMRANLPAREPDMLKDREQKDIYRRLTERSAGAPTFILHDGPPFSNGNIHMGTALNKVLKDFIVRYKTMRGFHAPYVPGWDNHGMPIESAIIKKSKLDRKNMTVPELQRLQRLCTQLCEYSANGVQAPGRHGRLGQPLSYDEPGVRGA